MIDLHIARPRSETPSRARGYWPLKRALDLTLCLLILPLVLPVMALLALAIRLDSPGAAIFRQERIGKDGRRFTLYKFRTIYRDFDDSVHHAFMRAFVRGQVRADEAEQGVYKPIQDREVTRVGRILRKTSLDELPQIFNVLKGEMSLVGPRPNVPWEVQEYSDWHKKRLAVLPGITGLAQVRGRSAMTFDKIVEYDLEYIARQSLSLDLQILWETVISVILADGAH